MTADRSIGTDHPFFPPLEEGEKEWLSVTTNYEAIKRAFAGDDKAVNGILGENAIRVLNLED